MLPTLLYAAATLTLVATVVSGWDAGVFATLALTIAGGQAQGLVR